MASILPTKPFPQSQILDFKKLCVCAPEYSICGSQNRALDPLELELQVVMSHPMRIVGTDPWRVVGLLQD